MQFPSKSIQGKETEDLLKEKRIPLAENNRKRMSLPFNGDEDSYVIDDGIQEETNKNLDLYNKDLEDLYKSYTNRNLLSDLKKENRKVTFKDEIEVIKNGSVFDNKENVDDRELPNNVKYIDVSNNLLYNNRLNANDNLKVNYTKLNDNINYNVRISDKDINDNAKLNFNYTKLNDINYNINDTTKLSDNIKLSVNYNDNTKLNDNNDNNKLNDNSKLNDNINYNDNAKLNINYNDNNIQSDGMNNNEDKVSFSISEERMKTISELEEEFTKMLKVNKNTLRMKSKLYQFINSELNIIESKYYKENKELEKKVRELSLLVEEKNKKIEKLKDYIVNFKKVCFERIFDWKVGIEKAVKSYIKSKIV